MKKNRATKILSSASLFFLLVAITGCATTTANKNLDKKIGEESGLKTRQNLQDQSQNLIKNDRQTSSHFLGSSFIFL